MLLHLTHVRLVYCENSRQARARGRNLKNGRLYIPTLLAVVFAVSGCGESPKIQEAKIIVSDSLTDPESAQFRKLEVIDKGNDKFVVCGEVNARNRMGGYVGYRTFIVVDKSAFILDEPNADDLAAKFAYYESIAEACAPVRAKPAS